MDSFPCVWGFGYTTSDKTLILANWYLSCGDGEIGDKQDIMTQSGENWAWGREGGGSNSSWEHGSLPRKGPLMGLDPRLGMEVPGGAGGGGHACSAQSHAMSVTAPRTLYCTFVSLPAGGFAENWPLVCNSQGQHLAQHPASDKDLLKTLLLNEWEEVFFF